MSTVNSTLNLHERAIKMLKDIDGNQNRQARKEMLSYDSEALGFLAKNGLIATRRGSDGKAIYTREFHGRNYNAVYNFSI